MLTVDAAADLLFMIVDPATGRLVGLCQGPDHGSRCGRAEAPPLPCEGFRVVPVRGTRARGLPFTVGKTVSNRCPMAWVEQEEDGEP